MSFSQFTYYYYPQSKNNHLPYAILPCIVSTNFQFVFFFDLLSMNHTWNVVFPVPWTQFGHQSPENSGM
jgi:hypothetical protein